MIKDVVENMGGVGMYGAISICLFVLVFTGAFIFAFAQKKSFCQTMSALPLDDGERPQEDSQ